MGDTIENSKDEAKTDMRGKVEMPMIDEVLTKNTKIDKVGSDIVRDPDTNREKYMESGTKGNSDSMGTPIETEKGEGEKHASLEPVSDAVVTTTEKLQDGDHSVPQKSEDDNNNIEKGGRTTPHISTPSPGVERSAQGTDSTQYLPTSEHIGEVISEKARENSNNTQTQRRTEEAQPQIGGANRRVSESKREEQRSQTHTAETQQRIELRQKPTKESQSQAFLDTGVSLVMNQESSNDEDLPMTERWVNDVFEQFVDEIAEDLSFEIHRQVKTGLLSIDEIFDAPEIRKLRKRQRQGGTDIFGQKQPREPVGSFSCSNCKRVVHPNRYAPHLGKCMGKTRRASTRAGATSSRPGGVGHLDAAFDPSTAVGAPGRAGAALMDTNQY